jgi:hypothetical protein
VHVAVLATALFPCIAAQATRSLSTTNCMLSQRNDNSDALLVSDYASSNQNIPIALGVQTGMQVKDYCVKKHEGEQYFSIDVPAQETRRVRIIAPSFQANTYSEFGVPKKVWTQVDIRTGHVPRDGSSPKYTDHVTLQKTASETAATVTVNAKDHKYADLSTVIRIKNPGPTAKVYMLHVHVHGASFFGPLYVKAEVIVSETTCPDDEHSRYLSASSNFEFRDHICFDSAVSEESDKTRFSLITKYYSDAANHEAAGTTDFRMHVTFDSDVTEAIKQKVSYDVVIVELDDGATAPNGWTVGTPKDFTSPPTMVNLRGIQGYIIIQIATTLAADEIVSPLVHIAISTQGDGEQVLALGVQETTVADVGTDVDADTTNPQADTGGQVIEDMRNNADACLRPALVATCTTCDNDYFYTRSGDVSTCVDACPAGYASYGDGGPGSYCGKTWATRAYDLGKDYSAEFISRATDPGVLVSIVTSVKTTSANAGRMSLHVFIYALLEFMHNTHTMCEAVALGEPKATDTVVDAIVGCSFFKGSTKVHAAVEVMSKFEKALKSSETKLNMANIIGVDTSALAIVVGDTSFTKVQKDTGDSEEITVAEAQKIFGESALSAATSSLDSFEQFIKDNLTYVLIGVGSFVFLIVLICVLCRKLSCCGESRSYGRIDSANSHYIIA